MVGQSNLQVHLPEDYENHPLNNFIDSPTNIISPVETIGCPYVH